MRITNGMSTSNMLRNLQYSNERMAKLQEHMSSGRRLNRPSDDPIGIARSLKFNRDLVDNTQFIRNAEDAKTLLDTADIALNDIGNIIQRAKELTIAGANGTLPQQSRDALAMEVNELLEQAIQLGNTAKGGAYVFAGSQVNTEPFTLIAGPPEYVQYSGDGFTAGDGKIEYEIAPGIKDNVNFTGPEVLGYFTPSIPGPPELPPGGTAADPNLFNHLISLRDSLYTDNQANIQQLMTTFDADLDNNLEVRATLGAKMNKLDLALARMENATINITDQIAKTGDADMAFSITQMKLEENIYRSALSVGARIIPPSLVDFLR